MTKMFFLERKLPGIRRKFYYKNIILGRKFGVNQITNLFIVKNLRIII